MSCAAVDAWAAEACEALRGAVMPCAAVDAWTAEGLQPKHQLYQKKNGPKTLLA